MKPFVKALRWTASQAKYQLSKKKPYIQPGGLKIDVLGHTIKITSRNIPTKDGKDSYHFIVVRPTKIKKLYTNYWPEVVAAVEAEIVNLEKNSSGLLVELWDTDASSNAPIGRTAGLGAKLVEKDQDA